MSPANPPFDWRAISSGIGAVLGGILLGKFFSSLELEVFAHAAARLVGLLSGAPVVRDAGGWTVSLAGSPIVVTAACSATDYFLIVAGLIGFQAARRRINLLAAAGMGLAAALPVTIFVNAVRIVTVAYAHPWLISRLPATYDAFLHMCAGAAVFLPSLIGLNLLLETHGNLRRPAPL
ncbi:MAG TPA: hypothetical protein VHO24_11930 [Opitutaceae bacterium]|nr:hypothetical protein [Opitutaceae bacterium]